MSEDFARKLDEYRDEYRRIAKNHGLDPERLRDIMELSTRGHNRAEIARKIGVTRQTVSRYLNTIKEEVNDNEFQDLVIGLLVIVGGFYLLKKLLEGR